MTLPPPPAKGSMYLFDSATPPLADGSYRLTVETDVPAAGVTPTFQQERYFDVVGPRFTVPQSMVAACYPPRNAHGAFQDTLPQIIFSRRTLPWERELVPPGTPLGTANPPPPALASDAAPLPETAVPWVALLLFEEGEYTLYRNLPLEQAVPPPAFQRLGSPAGITCDAVEAQPAVIAALLPSRQELQLLAHMRWVSVDDRELNIGGSDGFFSVVVSNRLPLPGAQYRAVLVSLEQRQDVVQENPPAVATSGVTIGPPVGPPVTAAAAGGLTSAETAGAAAGGAGPSGPDGAGADGAGPAGSAVTAIFLPPPPVRLIALTDWQFTCEGTATFQQLMQNLGHDNAMFGTVSDLGNPPVTDTGHLPIDLQDRFGAVEQVLYRGPLVPYPLTRDPLGPYHSADQARRVSPETGAEDISYAAAFEAGRLLAAADPRLAQSLMQWRREAYKQSARASAITEVAALAGTQLPTTLAETLHTPVAPVVATAAAAVVAKSDPPVADAYGLTAVAGAPGLDPPVLAEAWNLASVAEATTLLGDAGSLGAVVAAPAATVRPDTTLAAEAADSAGLARLAAARARTAGNPATTGGL